MTARRSSEAAEAAQARRRAPRRFGRSERRMVEDSLARRRLEEEGC